MIGALVASWHTRWGACPVCARAFNAKWVSATGLVERLRHGTHLCAGAPSLLLPWVYCCGGNAEHRPQQGDKRASITLTFPVVTMSRPSCI